MAVGLATPTPFASGAPADVAEAAMAAPVEPGTELARGYRVLAHLSRGNRLDVYDAWSDERASRCVLKTLRPDRVGERRARRALEQEGRLLRRFTHPHIVRAYGLTTTVDGGHPMLVLETLAGETLSHLIHRLEESGRRLPLVDAAMLGLQLASALHYLHGQGWLHLDLKPANIVAEAGRARLIDLSIARRPGRGRPGTGTLEYLSPEQARGGWLTTAADVWGLGAVLYAALAGQPPYGYDEQGSDASDHDTADDDSTDRTEPLELVYPQLSRDADPLRRHRRVPSELASIIEACLRREPTERPALPELIAGLEGWLAHDPQDDRRTGERG
jgi:serine/threonine protein kinase